MSSSSTTIPRLVAFLTRPLIGAGVPPAAVTTAQVILSTSFSSQSPPAGTLTLCSTTPIAPIKAACIGAGIPWSAWYRALADDAAQLVVSYGPGYLKTETLAPTPVFNPYPMPSRARPGPSPLRFSTLPPIDEDAVSSYDDSEAVSSYADSESDAGSEMSWAPSQVSSATDDSGFTHLSAKATPFVPARLRSEPPPTYQPPAGPRLFRLGIKGLSAPSPPDASSHTPSLPTTPQSPPTPGWISW
ncbi:Zn(2)-C6 fungal-type domain-containing protein [Mycena chlorophos]|uniref:Zn(2)-C6 fungal-type domain-containing protein n=1 Tax=Mycena chlorophos TaxID=658473 RepID=A0A8H6WAP1_MYCCL|nr:Zn(2)-C6 fungal-type domain-containing protein [Mycena chlorophos]